MEQWLNAEALAWLNDVPYATFQRRRLHLVEDDAGELLAVYAWQDIVRVNIEGLWLEVLAVSLEQQHAGVGRAVLALVRAHLATVERDGDALVGLVHADNQRIRNLLFADGWIEIQQMDGHDLLASRLH